MSNKFWKIGITDVCVYEFTNHKYNKTNLSL